MSEEHGLGRIPSPLDIKDYKLTAFMPPLLGNLSGSKAWPFLTEPLNQEKTNHCVGFAMADFGINLPVQDNYISQDGHDFYYRCKLMDGNPYDENGTNLRTAAKVLKQIGKISAYAFASTTDEITYWLLNKGPMIVGTDWTLDMFTPSTDNIIRPTGIVKGGHGYLLNEKTSNNYYHIQNSWGYWGIGGGTYISIDDFAALLRHGGEAMTAVELPITNLPTQNDGCLIALLRLLGMK